MKKDTIIRVVSIVGVFGVLYFIYKKMVNKNGVSINDNANQEPIKPTPTPTTTTFEKYVVKTESTPLNIRANPRGDAKILGKLNKGQEVLIKPSTTEGWMEYSTNGTTTFGYVSSTYVTKA
jgi:uncharacterized protein YgiM (DUF1202 family)